MRQPDPSAVLEDLSGHRRHVSGVFIPASREEVIEIVRWAAAGRKQLHAFSCGKNWGFGSRLAFRDGAYLVDLSRMVSIESEGLARGFIGVQPGVTQGMLDDALRGKGRSHYFNVTGAGRQTSVLGNALERGIGYFGPRADDILDLEVVLADGTSCWLADAGSNPFHAGLGPDLKGLFFQSAFGIVTAARIKVYSRPPCMAAVLIRKIEGAPLGKLLEAVAELRQEKTVQSVPHFGNRARLITTFGSGCPPEQFREHVQDAPEWLGVIPVAGAQTMVDAAFDRMGDRLGGLANCQMIGRDEGPADGPYQGLLDLVRGIPNDLALPAVSFAALSRREEVGSDLDAGRAGLIHLAPTCGTSADDCTALAAEVDELRRKNGLGEIPSTFNLTNSHTWTLVLSIPFDRNDTASCRKGQRFAKELLHRCRAEGFTPYRLGLEDASAVKAFSAGKSSLLQCLQEALDPGCTFSPSKYEPLWKASAPPPGKVSRRKEVFA